MSVGLDGRRDIGSRDAVGRPQLEQCLGLRGTEVVIENATLLGRDVGLRHVPDPGCHCLELHAWLQRYLPALSPMARREMG